jgi:subtilisin family serine protease
MLERTWKVAVIDSGLAPLIRLPARRARRFVDEGDRVIEVAPTDDHAGHGSLIAGIIASSPRPIELVIAQVLDHQGCGTAAAVAAAVDWAHAEGADLLHLSLGMPQDRPVLRASIGKVVAAGRVVVASSPARGSTAYPAAYPGMRAAAWTRFRACARVRRISERAR